MTWVKRGKDFWSSPDGRFDKLKVVTNNRKFVHFGRDHRTDKKEVVKEGETHFTVYDWDLGNSAKFRKESDAEEWVKEQQKKRPPALTPTPKSA